MSKPMCWGSYSTRPTLPRQIIIIIQVPLNGEDSKRTFGRTVYTRMIVEIVGPAGAGKSTIAQTLSQQYPRICCAFSLPLTAFMPYYFIRAFCSLPHYVWQTRKGVSSYWEALRVMVYLERLYRVLSRPEMQDRPYFLLDQGPIFLLAFLQQFCSHNIENSKAELWWHHMLNLWISVLDVIIWIDAPDAVLLERILQRNSWHRVKEMSEQDAFAFLTRYRETYWQIIPKFTAGGSVKLLRINSSEESVDQTVDYIVDVLETGQRE